MSVTYGWAVEDPESRREFLMPGSSLVECLVEGCPFALVLPPVPVSDGDNLALAAAMGLEVAAATLAHDQAEWVDSQLRTHLDGHSVMDWVFTVKALEEANAAWESAHAETRAERDRYVEMTEALSRRLAAAEDERDLLKTAVRETPPRARTSPPRDAMPLPAGIPMPVLDPMKEPIVPTDRREQGQVARKG